MAARADCMAATITLLLSLSPSVCLSVSPCVCAFSATIEAIEAIEAVEDSEGNHQPASLSVLLRGCIATDKCALASLLVC